MPKLASQFALQRCPHCNVDTPLLQLKQQMETNSYAESNRRYWRIYVCNRCGGVITASAFAYEQEATEIYPEPLDVDSAIPDRSRTYLEQALNSLSAPAGAVMLAASAVDAMLKAKGLKDGSLYSRIDEAATTHLITKDMATWAHDVRLDANDQRHADESVPLPTAEDAKRVVDFATALGQFLFVLPARVQRGIQQATTPKKP